MFGYVFHSSPPISLTHTHVFQKHPPRAQNKITHQSGDPEDATIQISH